MTERLTDQQIWDLHYRHLARQGVMTNRQVDAWYAAMEATARERRERPPEPARGRRAKQRIVERLTA
jgi:hypothetical protein